MTYAKFGYQWEDPDVETQCFMPWMKKILLIGSGGEVLFHLLGKFGNNIDSITCIDFNQAQIELVKKKVNDLSACKVPNQQNEPNNIYYGLVFEELFYKSFANDSWDTQFSNSNLITYFTEDAVKYTNSAFSTYFKDKCSKMDVNTPFYNLLRNKKYDIMPEYYKSISTILCNWHKVTVVAGDILSFLESYNLTNATKYDFMSLSNITDWLPADKCIKLYALISANLSDNGNVIMRRLLSENIITEQVQQTNILKINEKYSKAGILHDNTNFYSEVVCLTTAI